MHVKLNIVIIFVKHLNSFKEYQIDDKIRISNISELLKMMKEMF